MAARILDSVTYAVIRLAIWLVLFIVALIDGIRHRHIRSRGYQLYLALLVVTGLFFVRNLAYFAVAVEGDGAGWASNAAFGFYIFFSDLAESTWIAVLLAISAGFCITRSDLGPHKGIVTIIPIIFFVTSLVVDYVLFSVNGKEAFAYEDTTDMYEDEDYDPATDPINNVNPAEGLIFALCAVANSMAFILSWFYMYDTARSEWEALQAEAIARQTGEVQGISTGGAADTSSNSVGHVAIPVNAAQLLEEGQNASHLYGDVAVEDMDAPKNVADRIADRDKATLMRQFFLGVCIYITAAILVFFLPAFVPVAVDAALVIGYDALLWLFVAVLLFVFRMREGNQYLTLTEDGGYGGPEMTTELGVLSHDNDEDNDNHPSRGGLNKYTSAGNTSTNTAARFTLGDEDNDDDDDVYEDMEAAQTTTIVQASTSSGGDEVNASAAQHGVVVRSLQ